MKQKLNNRIEINKKNKDYVGADDSVRPIQRRNTQRGITLVALVITIIVLLILAMVSIKIAMDGGLTTKASDATTQHTIAAEKEAITTGYAAYQMALANKENETQPAIEGARVTPKGEDWSVIFTKTKNEYDLKKDGTVKLIKEGNASTTESTESVYVTPRTEVTYKGKTLKIGDYVNYDEGTGYTWTTDSGKGTGGDSNLTTKTYETENMNWRVLGLDKDGNLELISDRAINEKLTLKGRKGYINGEEQLNEMCNSLYGNGEKAKSARSVNDEDIHSILGYNKKEYKEVDNGFLYNDKWIKTNYYYGCRIKYTSTKATGEWMEQNEIITNDEFVDIEGEKATDEKPITIENTYYYVSEEEFKDRISSKVLNMVFNDLYWLSSKGVWADVGATWGLSMVSSSNIYHGWLYSSNKTEWSVDYCSVRPVVTLKSDIQLSGNSNDGWTIN